MRILVAPDKFKGSLTAAAVAEAVATGLLAASPGSFVDVVPVADGGDGTLDAALAAGFTAVRAPARGATGRPGFGVIGVRDGVAVVELAAACGLATLPDGLPAPLTATSAGVGDLLLAALEQGCHEVVLGIGGSASTDGGAGMLQALGARLLDSDGLPVLPDDEPLGGGGLHRVARVDLSGLDPRWTAVRVVLASDVDNPLLGAHGAAAVYGPQKGASDEDVVTLERGLARWAQLVDPAAAELAGAGAAGGVGFAALAALGAVRRPGIEVVLGLTRFAALLPGSTLVVTGEGRLDTQTLHGKAPAGVASAARAARVPVVAVCGQRDLSDAALNGAGIVGAYALTDIEPDVARCMAAPVPLLEELGRRIAAQHLGSPAAAGGGGR